MNTIKFSLAYNKLLDLDCSIINTAKLIEVLLIDREDLHPYFISYDTDNGKYVLPKKGISEVKKKYYFHEIDSFCCWLCVNLNVISVDKMNCKLLKIGTEPSCLCSKFQSPTE